MSVDGGGTKILSVLFDEHFRLIKYGVGGAINPNFENQENIKISMRKSIRECLLCRDGIEVEGVYISMPGPYQLYVDLLKEYAKVNRVYYLNEGQMAIWAGLQLSQGVVALAGTGSAVFWVDGDKTSCKGGWGSLLGDEGSGYYIGREGLVAAKNYYEGMGPYTVLYDLVINEWKLNDLRDIINKVYGSSSPRYIVASVALLVSKAAALGDDIAKNIYKKAGEEMAKQVVALLADIKYNNEKKLNVMIAGGAWKGSPIMFQAFKNFVKQSYWNVSIKIPVFEPVMGGVIKQASETKNSVSLEYLKSQFGKFLYKTNWIYENINSSLEE